MGMLRTSLLMMVFLGHSGSLSAQSIPTSETPNVLVIFSYDQKNEWEMAIGDGIVDTFGDSADLYFEYLDAKRIGNDVYHASLASHLRDKYASTPLACILTCNDSAFRFTKNHLHPLLTEVPIVFCGINFIELYDLSNISNYTGLVEKPSYDTLIEMLKANHPRVSRVHIFYFDAPEESRFRKLKTAFSPLYELVEHEPMAEPAFLHNLEIVDEDSLVIVGNVPPSLRRPFEVGEEDLFQCSAPIYASWIGMHEWIWSARRGLTGGNIISGEVHGKETAEIAMKILGGEDPAAIPIRDQAPNILAFNKPYLERFGIDEAMLPPGSRVMYGTTPFHIQYRWELVAIALFVIIETIVVLLLLENIRRRRHADRTVKRERGFIEQLLDTIPNPVFYKGTDGRYMGCNQAYARIVGLPRAEITGKTLKEVSSLKEADYFQEMDTKLFQNPGLQVLNSQFDGPDDEQRDVLINKATFLDEKGGVRGLIGIIQDITNLKTAERDLKAAKDELETRVEERTRDLASANRELEAFTYTASHDLRSPLRHMNAFSDILLDDYGDRLDEEGRDFLRRIKTASQEMNSLLEALLKLSRIHRAELTFTDVDITAITERLAEQMVPGQPSEVEIVIEKGMTAWGDPNLIRLLLQNLLENALKYSQRAPAPRIEIGSTKDAHGPRWFHVKDNGAGFDMEFVNKLFTPFQRLHSKAEFPGTGVGLASAARIVARHGGSIEAKGAKGQGATFRFSLAPPPERPDDSEE